MSKIKKNFSFLIPVIAFAVFVVFMAGCSGQKKAQEEKNKALARRILKEVYSQGKLDLIDEIYDTYYVCHTPGSPDIHGPEGEKQFVTMYRTAFPDLQFTVEDIIAEGDMVAIRWTGSGTHKGDLMGIPPTGVQVTWTGISIGRNVGDKVVEGWINWDNLGMLQQLGVIPMEEREDFTWGKPSEINDDPGDPEKNKAIARRAFEEVWNQRKLDVIEEIYAAEFILHDPAVGEVRGLEDLKQYISMYRTAFPDLHFTIKNEIVEGDKVVTRFLCTGTQKGELMGIPPTGVQVAFTGITIGRITGGKFVEGWVNGDDLGILQQLGVIPPMEQSEE